MSQISATIEIIAKIIHKTDTKNECHIAVNTWYDTFNVCEWDSDDVMFILTQAKEKVCNEYAKQAIQECIDEENLYA